MNAKKAKKLRRIVRGSHLPEHNMIMNPKTGEIRTGKCQRTFYSYLKANINKPINEVFPESAARRLAENLKVGRPA